MRERPQKPSLRPPEGDLCTILQTNFAEYPFHALRCISCSTTASWVWRSRSGRLKGDHDGAGPRSRSQDAAFFVARQPVPNVEPAQPPGPPLVLLGLEDLGVLEEAHGQVGLSWQPLVLEGDRGPARPAEGSVDLR